MKTSAPALLAFSGLAALAGFASHASAGTMMTKPRYAIIESLKVVPDDGDLNPDGFAYRVEGRIFAGNSPCLARGVRVGLRTRTQSGVIHVAPYRQDRLFGRGARPTCDDLYAPVYRDVAMTVRGQSSQTSDVVIHSVGAYGNDVSARSLLASTSESLASPSAPATLTGVFTRVMGAGGESTGLALQLADGRLVEIDLPTQVLQALPGPQAGLDALDGQTLALTGLYETRTGVESPSRQVLVVQSLILSGPAAP